MSRMWKINKSYKTRELLVVEKYDFFIFRVSVGGMFIVGGGGRKT